VYADKMSYTNSSLIVLAMTVVACGPNISEMRTVSAPARADNCELRFLPNVMEEMRNPKSEYEVVGSISLTSGGSQDAMGIETRELVRPRACAMGGEAIGLAMDANGSGGSSAVVFSVMRKRPIVVPASPTKF
jgi:hypothetical protein